MESQVSQRVTGHIHDTAAQCSPQPCSHPDEATRAHSDAVSVLLTRYPKLCWYFWNKFVLIFRKVPVSNACLGMSIIHCLSRK